MRTFDCELVNAIVNHPSVRPFVGGDGESELDLSEAVQNDDNIAYVNDNGGFLFIWTAPRCYEVHTFILPEGRGRKAFLFAREARDYMEKHGALHLWTRVKPEAENVRQFTLAAGFQPAGVNTVAGETYDLFDWRPECP